MPLDPTVPKIKEYILENWVPKFKNQKLNKHKLCNKDCQGKGCFD